MRGAMGAIFIVIGAATLFIGMLVNNKIESSIDRTSFSAAENTTYDGIKSNVNTAFSLMGISFIVAGAGIIFASFGGFAGGRM